MIRHSSPKQLECTVCSITLPSWLQVGAIRCMVNRNSRGSEPENTLYNACYAAYAGQTRRELRGITMAEHRPACLGYLETHRVTCHANLDTLFLYPPAAVSLQHNLLIRFPTILPTVTTAPNVSQKRTSEAELGAAGEDGSSKPGSRKEKDALDPPPRRIAHSTQTLRSP
ncbi:hypothetical protein EDB92DRAFT_2034076 [Lactarius akahatsu]|uniref:Uncharacterized protein n=1 Tax=Lactarius akahatsu TaxID=416441 RepID=A0AAD4QAD8_9AGAM|nr:hypothetical protein EDB92DRAFT_2034076 [Lactarius akahatsu]